MTDERFPGNPTQSCRTRSPQRVLGELHDREGHAPEVVQGMLAGLQRLREQGLDVVEDWPPAGVRAPGTRPGEHPDDRTPAPPPAQTSTTTIPSTSRTGYRVTGGTPPVELPSVHRNP